MDLADVVLLILHHVSAIWELWASVWTLFQIIKPNSARGVASAEPASGLLCNYAPCFMLLHV